ncbi:MAG TPA: dethiobiotin synthase [Polyangia bacterium]|jgi:dethiobiotin synthetase
MLLGTDTGVGKTTIGCGLLHLAHRRGMRLVPYKPAETGCDPEPQDARSLLHAATFCDCHIATSPPTGAHPDFSALRALTQRDICPYQFRPPLAPSAAARLAGTAILPRVLQDHAQRLRRCGDALLVEGAGGVLTPYGPALTGADLATLLDLPVLLVAANRLGTINHTALAVSELRRRDVPVLGIVLVDVANVAANAPPDHASNAAEIEALTGVAPLGILRHVAGPRDPVALAERLSADLDLRPLFDGRLTSQR